MTLSIHDTQPIPAAHGLPGQTYRVSDRLTDTFDIAPGERRRYVGTVIDSTAVLFSVRWDGGHGVARYAHDHEPTSLRPAMPADERTALEAGARAVAAEELRRLSRTQVTWPGEVRRYLVARAAELTGGT